MNVKKAWRKYHVHWAVGGLLTAICIFIQLLFLSPASPYGSSAKRLEGLAYDIRLQLSLPYQIRSKFLPIVIVDIDEKSLKQVGRFPWSRDILANLHSELQQLGVSVVAYDILFSEPQINPVDKVKSVLKDANHVQFLNDIKRQLDADAILADAIRDTDAVLGLLFEHQEAVRVGNLPATVFETSVEVSGLPIPEFSGHVANIDKLKKASLGTGFINSAPDKDGFVRYSMLMAKHNGNVYPALALEAARLYSLADTIEIHSQPFGESYTVQGISIANQLVPTDDYGRVAIPFRGPAFSFPYVSAVDVLTQNVDMSLFDQAIVFVGTSAVGHADLRATPVGVQYPGVEVHANVLEGLLFPELLPRRPDWIDGAIVLTLLVVGAVGAIILPKCTALGMLLYFFISVGAFISVDVYAWNINRIDVPQLAVLFLCASQTVLLGCVGFIQEHQQKVQIKSIFDQYVPPAHIQAMLEQPDAISMEGERRDMTVLFADIRQFTNISESLDASSLKAYLNQYFSPITQVIFEHQGTIDKYVGDMVMAFWNAPLQVEKHAEFAVKCALEMQATVLKLQSKMIEQGLPEFKIGIGLNTGEMNVGDMGSEYRRAYTVLGDSVNLGSRLESLTKYYGVGILVGEETMQSCSGIIFRPIDRVKVKGKSVAVTAFEPINYIEMVTEEEKKELALHEKAWGAYLAQQWDESLATFTTLNSMSPNKKVYQLFCQRIMLLKDRPPENEWDGSFTHKNK